MCEYDHAMGNAVGSIAEYWYAIRNANNHNMLGGFIWDWVDQSRFWSLDNVKNEFKGKAYDYYAEPDAHQNLYADDNDYHFFGYGGDYGDRPNDGSFCVNGLVSPDRDPQPELYEVKYQYQNFWFNGTSQEDFEGGWLHVYNESSFDNMNKFDLVMSVYEDDKCIGSETRTVDLAPRAETDVDIDYMKYIPQVKEGAEYRVNFEVKTKAALEADLDGSKVVLVPAGHEIAHEQFEIKNIRKAMAKTIATNKVDVSESDDVYKVKGDQFSFEINKQTGVIENYVYRDETLMITGPVPNFWRAPTNNDRNLERGWQQVGASVKADNIEVSENDKKQTVIKVDMSFDKAEGVTQTTEYTIDGSGAVTIAIKFDPTKCTFSEKRMLRVGTEMTLAENYEHVYWLGNGPSETMTDRCSGATVNAFETTVNRMFYPYLDTQETGTVTGLRWFTVTNEWNKTALAVAAKEDFEASALHFTDDQLTTARHPYELEKLDTTVLSVNNISTGAGNASCGPDTLDEYRITSDKTYEYEYTLVPYTASNAFWGVPEYVSEATRMYRSEPSDYVYAEVKDVDKERPTLTPAPIQPTAVPTQTQAPAATSAPTPSAAPSEAPAKTDAVTKPAAVKKLTAKCVSRKKGVKLSWKKISSAKGYVLERSLKKNKGFKAVKVLNKNSVVKFTDKKVKKGKTYYYRIRAFVKDGSKKVYGKYSKVVKVKVKK
jgi:beta-galactosidase